MQKIGDILNEIAFLVLFDLYWPKSRMASSFNTYAESHKRTFTFVFTLYIVDIVQFDHKDRTLKCTVNWLVLPNLLISLQRDSWDRDVKSSIHICIRFFQELSYGGNALAIECRLMKEGNLKKQLCRKSEFNMCLLSFPKDNILSKERTTLYCILIISCIKFIVHSFLCIRI